MSPDGTLAKDASKSDSRSSRGRAAKGASIQGCRGGAWSSAASSVSRWIAEPSGCQSHSSSIASRTGREVRVRSVRGGDRGAVAEGRGRRRGNGRSGRRKRARARATSVGGPILQEAEVQRQHPLRRRGIRSRIEREQRDPSVLGPERDAWVFFALRRGGDREPRGPWLRLARRGAMSAGRRGRRRRRPPI